MSPIGCAPMTGKRSFCITRRHRRHAQTSRAPAALRTTRARTARKCRPGHGQSHLRLVAHLTRASASPPGHVAKTGAATCPDAVLVAPAATAARHDEEIEPTRVGELVRLAPGNRLAHCRIRQHGARSKKMAAPPMCLHSSAWVAISWTPVDTRRERRWPRKKPLRACRDVLGSGPGGAADLKADRTLQDAYRFSSAAV